MPKQSKLKVIVHYGPHFDTVVRNGHKYYARIIRNKLRESGGIPLKQLLKEVPQ